MAVNVKGESGQMTVELAVVIPVALVALLIIVNVFYFFVSASTFDHVAPQAVVFSSMDLDSLDEGFDASEKIRSEITRSMGDSLVDRRVSVSVELADEQRTALVLGQEQTYRCELRYTPWPAPRSFSIAGASTGSLSILVRSSLLTVDPCFPGVVF